MALTDVSGNGAGGAFVDAAGSTISWTSNISHFINSAQYGSTITSSHLSNNNDVVYNFSDGAAGGVTGLAVAIVGLDVSRGETVDFIINGADVNLQTLIDNGNAQIVPRSDWPASQNVPDGDINPLTGNVTGSTGAQDGLIISFNIEITNLTLNLESSLPDNFLADIFIDSNAVICFASGTHIKTQSGERAIETLTAGDMVLTMDNGYQSIRWVGSTKVKASGDLAPILIRKGALGNEHDLRVSPQHRMLLQGWQAELLFGETEVLATAKSLVNDHSIIRVEGGEVEYFHMLFGSHEIVWAEGAPSESLHLGEQGWKALDQAARDEILTLFPHLADDNFGSYGPSARLSLKHKEGRILGQNMISGIAK